MIFYNGGGFFENASQYQNTKVIASYTNNLLAIIFINYVMGRVILSGVYFEYSLFLLNRDDKYIRNIIEYLYKSDKKRLYLFKKIFSLLV